MKIVEHMEDTSLHFTEDSISHGSIQDAGTYTHSEIDAHIDDTDAHIDWTGATDDLETTGDVTAACFHGWGTVPIGGVIPWLKSLTGTPSLPDGWAECNGQTLSDSDSVYDGEVIPDLNGSSGSQRFLRGATVSGGTGGSDTHVHTLDTATRGFYTGYLYYAALDPYTTATESASTLPKYYETVMVVRVK